MLRLVLIVCGVIFVTGCASRPQIELDITRSEVARAYARGAKVLAPAEYASAAAALHEAELLVYREKYSRARETLNRALLHASKASAFAIERAAAIEMQRQAETKVKEVEKKDRQKPVIKKPVPEKPKVEPLPVKPVLVLLDQVTVEEGETLYSLAGRRDIYNDPLLWPLIYKANRDQIKDPKIIFMGQIFTIPRDKSHQEQDAARKDALDSGLFRSR